MTPEEWNEVFLRAAERDDLQPNPLPRGPPDVGRAAALRTSHGQDYRRSLDL